jgi:actin-related protein
MQVFFFFFFFFPSYCDQSQGAGASASGAGSSMRAEICELLFEGQGVPGIYIARSAPLAAFAAYRGTALVVDLGGGGCSATAVHDGFVLGGAGSGIARNNWGGEELSDLLARSVRGMAYVEKKKKKNREKKKVTKIYITDPNRT